MRPTKKILQSQIEVYLEWGRRSSIASISYKEWLDAFLEFTDKHDVMDVNYEDIDLFIEKRQDIIRTNFTEKSARRALEGLLRFYMARTRNAKMKLKMGRPPHLDEIAEVQRLRGMRDAKGNHLSFRAIQKIMGKPVALVHRWSKYVIKDEDK